MCFARQSPANFNIRLPKMARDSQFFTLLTSECASHHKRAWSMRRLWHFDFEMCFVPQRRALFEHLNFQKGLTSKCASRRSHAHFPYLNFQKCCDTEVFCAV
jgi:hypothetical protein